MEAYGCIQMRDNECMRMHIDAPGCILGTMHQVLGIKYISTHVHPYIHTYCYMILYILYNTHCTYCSVHTVHAVHTSEEYSNSEGNTQHANRQHLAASPRTCGLPLRSSPCAHLLQQANSAAIAQAIGKVQ